ncbi:MAG: NADH-dependent [FeFe] hydrogenase, group A6 [Planctomycetaceae bacterium]|nr:NADH-dependent [FeFe] hydrogenase, group A6 [Planctomycetaceae bacterium]
MINLTINNVGVEVPAGATILDAAKKAGMKIPTLCNFEGHAPQGACRVCVVEVEGGRSLAAACSMPAAEGMKVQTNTRRVRNARRTTVELLLSEHDGDCQTCNRNQDCELRAVAADIGIQSVKFSGSRTRPGLDTSTPALIRDNGKCIKCRRCVTVCNNVQGVAALWPQSRGFETTVGPAFERPLDTVTCVQCGQCASVCPVGAIIERDQIQQVWAAIDDPSKTVVVQTAPAIRAALGECFNMPPGTLVTGKMVAALRRLGFKAVFDTNFTADLTILEEGTELLTRLKKLLVDKDTSVKIPMFTSCSPGWVNYIESMYPDLLPNVSTCKSPMSMFGALVKTYWAKKQGLNANQVIDVAIMPCTAKKFEASRPEMTASGVKDIDYVLTTRELGRMISEAGIDFASLPDEKMDFPLGLSSGAADIFANTGGVMEAALRTVYEIVTGRDFPLENLHVTPIAGLEGVKEASITFEDVTRDWKFLEGVTAKVAVAHGLVNAAKVCKAVRDGTAPWHFIEVMCCPGGCIGGGGQPRFTTNEVRKARIGAIYAEDEGKQLRKSHQNPDITKLYEEFLGAPLGETSHHLLHTKYTPRERV